MSAEETFRPKTEQETESGENNTISSFKIYVFFKQPVIKQRNKRWKKTVSHMGEDKCIQNLDQNM
jgi:hypothetical protein